MTIRAQGEPIIGHAGAAMIHVIAARPGVDEFVVVADRTLQIWTRDDAMLTLTRSASDFENQPFTWNEPNLLTIQVEETDSGLNVKDAATGHLRATISDPAECRTRLGCSVSPDNTLVATICNEQVFVWETTTGTLVIRLHNISVCESYTGSVTARFYWANNTRYLYFQGRNGGCYPLMLVWNVHTGETVWGWAPAVYNNPNPTQEIIAAAWSSDWTRLAAIATDELRIMNTTTWETLLTFPAANSEYGLPVLAWSPDSTRIALTLDSMTVEIWDATTGQALVTLDNRVRAIRWIAWSPDGARLATVETYGKLHIWDANTGQMFMTLPTPGGSVVSLLWKPDGTQLASTDYNGNVEIWDVQ